MSNKAVSLLAPLAFLVAPSVTWAKSSCPPAVTDAALKAFPGSKIVSCKAEKEHGKTQLEVKLDTKDEKQVELDISPEGTLLLTEEKVAIDSVPQTVMTAFAAKYPKAKADRAEKQTSPDGATSYELAFVDHGKKHEATFSSDGKFVDEE